MTSLSQVIKIIKKIGPVAGIILLILVLSMIIFVKYSNKNQPKKPQNPIPEPKIFQETRQKQPQTFVFPDNKNVKFPQILPIYMEHKIELSENIFNEIAASLGFIQEPSQIEDTTDGKQYSWQHANSRLSVSQTVIRYTNNSEIFSGEKLGLAELQAKAGEFIGKIPYMDQSLVLNQKETRFINIKYEDFESAKSLEDASVVELNYFKFLSNSPVFYGIPEAPFLKIRINTDGTIIYFEARLYKDFTELETYPLKNINEAKSQIKAGRGKVVQTSLPDEHGNAFELYRIQPFDIDTLIINNIYLAFFLSSDSMSPTQPIYVFEGEFNNTLNQTGKATIYLPAIED